MIHRTFRSLDDPPKLVGFTIGQWVALIAASAVVLAIVGLTHLPGKPAITLLTFTVGLPAALTYVSESGGLKLGRLLADMLRWRLARKRMQASEQLEAPQCAVVVLQGEHHDHGEPAGSRAEQTANRRRR